MVLAMLPTVHFSAAFFVPLAALARPVSPDSLLTRVSSVPPWAMALRSCGLSAMCRCAPSAGHFVALPSPGAPGPALAPSSALLLLPRSPRATPPLLVEFRFLLLLPGRSPPLFGSASGSALWCFLCYVRCSLASCWLAPHFLPPFGSGPAHPLCRLAAVSVPRTAPVCRLCPFGLLFPRRCAPRLPFRTCPPPSPYPRLAEVPHSCARLPAGFGWRSLCCSNSWIPALLPPRGGSLQFGLSPRSISPGLTAGRPRRRRAAIAGVALLVGAAFALLAAPSDFLRLPVPFPGLLTVAWCSLGWTACRGDFAFLLEFPAFLLLTPLPRWFLLSAPLPPPSPLYTCFLSLHFFWPSAPVVFVVLGFGAPPASVTGRRLPPYPSAFASPRAPPVGCVRADALLLPIAR